MRMSAQSSNVQLIQFMNWPALKRLTFIAIGNYFKLKKNELEIAKADKREKEVHQLEERLSDGILRADVYKHIDNILSTRKSLPFGKVKKLKDGTLMPPPEQMPWKYVDELKDERFLVETKEPVLLGGKRHYWFRMTEKGEQLFRTVQFGMNFGPEDIPKLVDDPKASEQLKKKLDTLMDKGFPFGKKARSKK